MLMYMSDFCGAYICKGEKVFMPMQISISCAYFCHAFLITGQPQTATVPSQSHSSSTSPRHSRQLRNGGIIQRAQSCITPSSPVGRSTRPTGKNTRELHAAELSLSQPRRQSGEDFSRAASSGRRSTSPPKRSTHISSGSAFYSRIIEQQVGKLHVNNLARS